jgi:hypothetical protein
MAAKLNMAGACSAFRSIVMDTLRAQPISVIIRVQSQHIGPVVRRSLARIDRIVREAPTRLESARDGFW